MKYLILDNIRSMHNVGSIFRTADGAGVSKIFLVGYTPLPIDRFGRTVAEIEKTSLGASAFIPYEHASDLGELMVRLQREGVSVVVVEQHERAIDYRTYNAKEHTAYILGNEILGVDARLCEMADAVIHIPMHGKKESLNVSVAAGVILFASLPAVD